MLYMQEVEKMEGYGQESFQAKVNLRRSNLSASTIQTENNQNVHINWTETLALLHSFVLGIVLPTRVLSSSSKQDSTGTDVTLGSCLDGIIIKHKNGRPLVLFRYDRKNL